MKETHLIPAGTVLTSKGDGPVVTLTAPGKVFLLTLDITRIVEQEALDVSVIGSVDGTTWEPKPLAVFPQKFYAGQHPLLLDLSQRVDLKALRAHWEVNRWGRGSETPMFEVSLQLREVPPDVLKETMAEAGARR
ncbi:MAG: hypothetical protein HYX28_06805 [Candidatus Koribacter versatilis]|uniref:Uncharacterized protein n=1 Tax=Candidatus Korobacter versatilis TaxID=658062 RepID=A0A932AA78_9BACT|nr:hypothetical protein [Candidatus Koribacter versatilis]